MLKSWKRQLNRAGTLRLLRKFVRLVITIDDTPTLIRSVAEHKQFMVYCSVAIKGDKNTDPEHFRLYRDLEQETHRQGFSFDKLKKKLSLLADALGLHVQMNKSLHADYYQILGVPENADIDAIKKAFRAKARLTHPDTTSGENNQFPVVLEAYKVLSDSSSRRTYNLSKKQKSQWEWSESSRNKKDETLKKHALHKYGVHFFLIILFLILTALIADFVMQQHALFDGAHKAVTAKKPLLFETPPEMKTSRGTQHIPPEKGKEILNETLENTHVEEDHNSYLDIRDQDDEKLKLSNADKPINKLKEIKGNEVSLKTQHIPPEKGKEILNETLENTHVEEDHKSYHYVEYHDEENLRSNADKNLRSDGSLKKINKKHEKKRDVPISQNLKIEQTNQKNFGMAEPPDIIASDVIKNDHDASNLVKSINPVFPDQKEVTKTDHTVSEGLLLNNRLNIKNELEQFVSRYCDAYEKQDLKRFMGFFAENATENGMAIKQLFPKYQKNFQNLASIQYRISIGNYTLDPEFGRIEVNGLFFLRWRKKQEKQWHNYNGSIRLNLISDDDSFFIRELDYRFTD
jgi:curved DNA-binding protein CbpA